MNQKTLPYLLLLPATLFLLVFFVYPFIQVAVQAFVGPSGFTLDHFQTMARNFRFWPSVRNTILLAVVVVPLQLVMALAMASTVSNLKTARSAILYIFTIPLGLSDLAAGIIWLAIFEQSGFLNSMLTSLGVINKPILFLSYQNSWVIFLAVVLAELESSGEAGTTQLLEELDDAGVGPVRLLVVDETTTAHEVLTELPRPGRRRSL